MSLRTEINTMLKNMRALCDEHSDAHELSEELAKLTARLDEPLRVAVVGIMKAGKSTFMNALMEGNVVYTGELETTYTVCWFKYAASKSLTIYFRDGRPSVDAPYEDMQTWSERSAGEENPEINNVKYIVIYYPSEILKKIEFIDTPGLNSIYGTDAQNSKDFLSIQSSEDTIKEASFADAVIYAFNRTANEFDKEILEAFQKDSGVNASPINSLGIMTKVDASGIWDLASPQTPVEIARKITANVMSNSDMKNSVFEILPVCAKVIEGAVQLNETDWSICEKLAGMDAEDEEDYLFDSASFEQETSEDFMELGTPEERRHLMGLIGQYGIAELSKNIRAGRSRYEIFALLPQICGIRQVRDLIASHFGSRAFLIKIRYVFNYIHTFINNMEQNGSMSRELKYICERFNENVDNLMSSLQPLRELRIIQMYYNGGVEFTEAEKHDFMCVTGEHGRSVERRLDAPEGSSVEDLKNIANEKMSVWKANASRWMKPGSYVEAARIIARSYEHLYYHLSELTDY